MSVTVDPKVLQRLLAVARPAVRSRGGMLPILTGVRITAADGSLSVTGSDLDRWITATAPVGGELDIVVNHRTLSSLIATATGPVTLTATNETTLGVSWGTASAELRAHPAGEYPKGHDFEVTEKLSLSANDVDSLRRVAQFASTDDNRPIITGLLIDGTQAVATDSYRLGVAELAVEPIDRKVLIPRSAVALLPHRMLDTESLDLELGERTCRWSFDGVTVTARLIEGEFPNWRGLVDVKGACTIECSKADLDRVIATVSAIAAASGHTPVKLSTAGGSMSVAYSEQDVGTVVDRLDAEITGEAPAVVAFSPTYLRSVLAALRAEGVSLRLTDALKPARFDEPGLFAILMPVRVS